jgi:hypothetical protein
MDKDYEVIGQREVVDLGSDGAPVNAQEITFKSLPSGTVASVRVPLRDFSATTAQAAIEARRNVIEAVHAL